MGDYTGLSSLHASGCCRSRIAEIVAAMISACLTEIRMMFGALEQRRCISYNKAIAAILL